MKPNLGKFEGCGDDRLAQILYKTECNEEMGSVMDLGWYGLIIHRNHAYIVEEDNFGFFDYTRYESIPDAVAEWKYMGKRYDEYYNMEGGA